MRLSVSTWGNSPAELVAIGVRADRLGFDAIWIGEHLVAPIGDDVTPHPYRPEQVPPVVGPESRLADPWVVIGAMGAVTQRIRLATGVCVLPLRHPLLSAQDAVTAHEITNGRVVLGVGSGWLREEFEALGVPFAERGARLDEAVDIARLAFAGGPFRFHGEHYAFADVQITPEPTPIPIVMGGGTPPALRRAARRGDGWCGHGKLDLDELLAMKHRLDELRREYGTVHRPFSYFVRVDSWKLDDVAPYIEAGFEDITVSGFSIWPGTMHAIDDKLAALDEVASELAPLVATMGS